MMKKSDGHSNRVGLIFGKFYPLHRGHLFLIEQAAAQVDQLHVMLGVEASRDLALFNKSNLPKQPSVNDRLSWLKVCFCDRDNIVIHELDEAGIAFYPDGWKEWSDKVKSILSAQSIYPTTVFTSEIQDQALHQRYFNCEVILVDVDRVHIPISATEIRQSPYQNWTYLSAPAQRFFSRYIGFDLSEDNQLLATQLANIYQTNVVPYDELQFNDSILPFQFTLIPEHKKTESLHCEAIILLNTSGEDELSRLNKALELIHSTILVPSK